VSDEDATLGVDEQREETAVFLSSSSSDLTGQQPRQEVHACGENEGTDEQREEAVVLLSSSSSGP
jgi:hypothetical protein